MINSILEKVIRYRQILYKIYNAFLDELKTDRYTFKKIVNRISPEEYLDTLKQNILSNFNVYIKKLNVKVFSFDCNIRQEGNNTIKILNYDNDVHNIINNVVSFSQGETETYHFVKTAIYNDEKKYTVITVYPHPDIKGAAPLNVYGYIGDMLHQYSSILYMEQRYEKYEEIIRSVLQPDTYQQGEYVDIIDNIDPLTCNESQSNAISNLKHNIEIIHGPPGTGKSTTIANIIEHKIPYTHTILCTAVQNQAIESLLLKLLHKKLKFIVIGNEDRLGEESKKYTFDAMCYSNSILRRSESLRKKICIDVDTLKLIISDDIAPRIYKKIIKKYSLSTSVKLSDNINKLETMIHDLDTKIKNEKNKILNSVNIVLCTSATAYKIYRIMGKQIDTVIFDEAGATNELHIPSILRLSPKNIILVGDPNQLRGFCNIPTYLMEDRLYNISLMERMIKQRNHSILTIQYRMHPNICNIVSDMFYFGKLKSHKSVIRKSRSRTVEWINITKTEEKLDDLQKLNGICIPDQHDDFDITTSSMFNVEEIDVIQRISRYHKKRQILIITSYNAQASILRKLIQYENVDIRSIDSSQGMESDIVIISLVRSNDSGNIGFLHNENRMCVMLSRAKNRLYIVGNVQTFLDSRNSLWTQCIQKISAQYDAYDRLSDKKSVKVIKKTNGYKKYKNIICRK